MGDALTKEGVDRVILGWIMLHNFWTPSFSLIKLNVTNKKKKRRLGLKGFAPSHPHLDPWQLEEGCKGLDVH